MTEAAADAPEGAPAEVPRRHARTAPPNPPDATPPTGSIGPMMSVRGELPQDEDAWATEVKWDGVRALVWCAAGRCRLFGRNGNESTGLFPEIAPLADQTGDRTLVLDGEIVMFNRDGLPDFELIQHRLGGTPPARRRDRSAAFMIFDLLFDQGTDLRRRPWEERRSRLEALGLGGDRWQVPPAEVGGASEMFTATSMRGLEGIVLKRIDSPYRAGRRHPDWRKVKHRLRQEFVVGGWLPGKGSREDGIGALLLGHFEDGQLTYDGRVGSGLSEADLEQAATLLAPLAIESSPFAATPADLPAARFVRPVLVAEVEFHHRTTGGLLRHPVFKAWRHDKRATEVGPE